MTHATIQDTAPQPLRRRAPADRFDGHFGTGSPPRPARRSLTGRPEARAWLAMIDDACRTGRYTFQAPLEGCAGPRAEIDGQEFLLLSSYDYLGLAGDPRVAAASSAAIHRHGTGTGGVRLLTGTNVLHRELERALAAFKRTEEAMVFSSGYLTNLAAITSLFGPGDLVLLDDRCHRSTIDGCRLGRVAHRRFRHNDPDDLAAILETHVARRKLIVAEGIYSMDGDVCPLPELVALKQRYGAFLMIDEAHSIGVLGETGRGVDEELGVSASAVDLWMGSLSKAIPSSGGYLAGQRDVIYYLQHGAAPFMFSAAQCPAASSAALEALKILREEPWRAARARRNGRRLREGLRRLGFDTSSSSTPVIPVAVPGHAPALGLARAMWDRGVAVSAIVAPAVAPGSERLRLCTTAAHSDDDIDEALAAFADVKRTTAPELAV